MMDRRDGVLADEILFWVGLSGHFYAAFNHIRRHFGPLWFTINVIAKSPEKQRTFGSIRSALEDVPAFGSNSWVDLTNYLEHLREVGYVKILDPKQRGSDGNAKEVVRLDRAEKDKNKKRYLKTHYTIAPTTRFDASRQKYAQDICEVLFGWEAREKVKGHSLQVMPQIYEFLRTRYLGLWNGFLDRISQRAVPDDEDDTPDTVLRAMLGSTEYFVLLHTLWIARLRGEDRAGLSVHTIFEGCRRIRALSETIIISHIDFLRRNRLLAIAEHGVRLADECWPTFQQFGTEI